MSHLDIGAAVLCSRGVALEDGVVLEVVRPGKLPKLLVRGAPSNSSAVRYVVRGDGFQVLRRQEQLRVVAP